MILCDGLLSFCGVIGKKNKHHKQESEQQQLKKIGKSFRSFGIP